MHICIECGIIIQMGKIGLFFKRDYCGEGEGHDAIVRAVSAKAGDCREVFGASDLDGLEVLMVFGGDGTILTLASECARRGIKIMGVNYGHVGFLAEFEPERLDEAIELILSGDYHTEQRSMLRIFYEGEQYFALNDLVIQRCTSGSDFTNTISLRAAIDGAIVDNYTADGLIVSTPTGSTAYSLAAGGSVLTPDIGAFIMTPICAHSLHSRPVVFGDRSTLTIDRLDRRGAVNVVVDGNTVATVCEMSRVKVIKADRKVTFITSSDNNFFNKLLIKLNIWSK